MVSKHIDLEGREPAPSPAKEDEVREGIRLLQRAVAIEPRSWPAHCLIGKGYQALDDHPGAYEAFREHVISVLQKPFDIDRVLKLLEQHCGDAGGPQPEQPAV